MTTNLINKETVNIDNTFTSVAHENSTILLIGNDQRLSNQFKNQLYTHGYQVIQKHRDENILTSISLNKPYLIILDIGFSNLAMMRIISKIRAIFNGPLVLLTSRDSEKEQVTAFNLGADEYLVKPVSENILNVRIDSLFRRFTKKTVTDQQTQIQLGDLTLYPYTYKCQLGGENIPLTQFEFKLIRLLADNVGKIMSRDLIYKSLLGREYNGSERTVDVRVSQLRDKLTKTNQSNIQIETVWGQGYMLNTDN